MIDSISKNLILTCEWFHEISESSLKQITEKARTKIYQSKHYLYNHEKQNNFVYGIKKGFIRVKMNSIQGHEFTVTEFSEGDWLGELALSKEQMQVFEVETITECELLEIPVDLVKSIAEKEPVVYKNLFQYQSRITQKLCRLLEGMLFYPLKSRIAARLLWLGKQFGEETEQGLLINKKMSQQDIATLSMGSRQKINQIFREWQSKDFIEMQEKKYLIKDQQALFSESLLND